jgi:hypothetical protein
MTDPSKPTNYLALLYDRLFTQRLVHRIEQGVIGIAVAGFLIHLLLIATSHLLVDSFPQLHLFDTDYLAAIYTPFSIILFYEVFSLVQAIPLSFTTFIAKQYEIIALVIIREVFKDIAQLHQARIEAENVDQLRQIMIDTGGGLGMFLMVIVFYHINKIRRPISPLKSIRQFIDLKKALTFILSIVLVGLALVSGVEWLIHLFGDAPPGVADEQQVTTLFYHDFFSILIFTDVFLLIISLRYTNTFDLIFRNAGFIISTILVRISLNSDTPYHVSLAAGGMLVGILTLAFYVYYRRLFGEPVENPAEKERTVLQDEEALAREKA